ncbi:MAG: isoprenylcysteine carboxylmethyltransferase family protein [Anaerolineales bacterium]|nr:MAG: isoprenylcysteine carboxylmethyltransferase family protein [Anaerolineales bacterium]
MDQEIIFRTLFILSGVAMFAIRIYYQSKVRGDLRRSEMRDRGPRLIPGSIAALVTLIFGAEYIFFPGTFSWAYLIHFPTWLRYFGVVLLVAGISLLWLAHHHLGKSFHSLVVLKEDQVLVESGPYRFIRHPIYSAYFMNYIGGGLLASNWVLAVIPVVFFGLFIALRVDGEEKIMVEKFGDRYIHYMKHTGRFLPSINLLSQRR